MHRLAALIAVLLAACGGGGGPTDPGSTPPPPPPPLGTANFTATIEGQSWAALSSTVVANASASGTYTISGGTLSGGVSRGVTLTLMNIPGPGTYPLGTGAGVSGGIAIYADNTGGWGTPLSGAAGTVTLATLTTSRIAGTFSFTGEASAGAASGTRRVSNGAFDLALTAGTTTPVPETSRNILRATLNGEPWNASTVVRIGTLATLFGIGGNNTQQTINISAQGISGPGTYAVGPGGVVSVTINAPPGEPVTGPLCCWNSSAGGTGSLVVTSLTATRMAGTFAFTLPTVGSGAATAPMVVTNGSFDVGI